ncbi:MAG: S41 family peptidase [Alphaproteobacteria bacterium]|nr:S41 family peptidase [Alphaproteobacteria bacterium]
MRTYLIGFVLAFALLAGASTLHTTYAQDEGRTAGSVPSDENNTETYRQLNLFGDVFERVRSQYVEETEDKDLIENAVNGMLTSLDPHSAYLNEERFQEMQVNTRGEFGGLGIEVTMENGFVKVVSPIDDTPAFRAGVKAGDYITHIDGESVLGLGLNEAVDKMRGKVGTDINLTISREEADGPLDLTITRDIIKIRSVRSRVEGNVGYIRITTFNQNTEPGLKEAIKDINEELGNKITGYVLDLRNNPGGLLDQAIAVSDAFLDKGEIVSTRGRNEEDTKRDNATPGDMANGLPIVVLINGGSASASEIVSGALQDHKRAILLGTDSFGKGSVQTVIPLPGHGAMRLTTARYYTPSGRSIQAKGITPDIYVEPAKVESFAVNRIKESDLRGALANPDGDDKKAPANDNDEDGENTDEEVYDYQLERALDLINGLSLYEQGLKQSGVMAPEPAAESTETTEDATGTRE